MSKQSKLLSRRDFAKRVGLGEATIRNRVNDGTIVLTDGKVDYEKYYKIFVDNGWCKLDKIPTLKPIAIDQEGNKGKIEVEQISITEARRRNELARARISEIEVKRLEGVLVEKDLVYKELYGIGQEIRFRLEQLPDKVVDSMLAQDTRNKSHEVLRSAIDRLLNDIADLTNKE